MYDFHSAYCNEIMQQAHANLVGPAEPSAGSPEGQREWIVGMAGKANLTVTELGRKAGLLERLAALVNEEETITPREMALITSVVLDDFDAIEVAKDHMLSAIPASSPSTHGEWLFWARSGVRRESIGQKHVTLADVHRRTGIPMEHLLDVEHGRDLLTAAELDEVARALKVEVPSFQITS